MDAIELCGLSRSAGGLFYAMSSLCKAMHDQGVGVSVYGRADPHTDSDRAQWGNVSTVQYQSYGPLQTSFQLRRLLKQNSPDLIHQHGIWLDDQWAALQWQSATKRPVIISPHGMLDPWALQNSTLKKKVVGNLFADRSLREATCLHALCQSEAASIRAYGLKNPIAIIPNGIELPEIGGRNAGGGDQRTEIDFSNPKPQTINRKKQLLFLGRIHPKKGLKELLEAWSMVQSKNPKAFSGWQLLIAGWDDGNHLEGLKEQASQLGFSWSDAVSEKSLPSDIYPPSSELYFLGPKFGAEKEALLRSVDAFILPSFSEGLPMSVLEAWSYELPVVMTEFCNIPEGFSAKAAIRVEPDFSSVAEGLNELFSFSNEERWQLGRNGRKLVERSFTWTQIAQDMKAVYQWCLGGPVPSVIKFD
ncbi:glycosyltransferase [Pontiellaceae bacterium B1224]|nr:glycosyltransferase [Pontiellaceae bacterium B1224]